MPKVYELPMCITNATAWHIYNNVVGCMRGGDDHKPSVAAAQKMILLMATHWKVVLGVMVIITALNIISRDKVKLC